jgi:Flp pilus assembly protein TadD
MTMAEKPQDAALRLALDAAKAAHRSNRPREAEAGYREALRLDPDSCAALYGLGMLFLQTGRPDEAAAFFGETAARDPR